MTLGAIILNIVLLNPFIVLNNKSDTISCHFANKTFTEFSEFIFDNTGRQVYYQESWVKDVKINIENDHISLNEALQQALSGTGLDVSAWHGDFIILKNQKLLSISNLISEKAKSKVDTFNLKYQYLTESEEKYITGRKADVVKTIQIGSPNNQIDGITAKIIGRIVEKETGEPLIGATVYISEIQTGGASDMNGYINLVLKTGKYHAEIESMGYRKQKVYLEVNENGNFVIELEKSLTPIKEVVVHGDRQSNMVLKDPGLEKVSIKSIRELPMMMGERDIIRISELLPGIVTVGEGSTGLNVRGGSADQNAFYINKIPIYNTAHLFGFFPAFNADIIKDFSIYKGHIPTQYGGHLSSVFNLISRQGNRKKISAKAGINPISANMTIDGPIVKDKLSFLMSGRSSYSDWILSRINDPTIRTSKANFYDFSGGLNYDMNNSQFSFFIYGSNDSFKLADISHYQYENLGASLDFRHQFSTSLRANVTLIASEYAFSTIDKQEISLAYKHNYSIKHYEFRSDFTQNINENHSFKYGVNSVLYNLNRGQVIPFGEESLKKMKDLGFEKGIENSLYFSDDYNYLKWININAGIRFNIYAPLGPAVIYKYYENEPVDTRYVYDSILVSDNKPYKYFYQPDLRLAINLETDVNGSVKIAFNQMHQNLFMLSNTITVAPNTQWKLSDYYLKPSKSNQFSLGLFRNLPKLFMEASVELYYKTTNDFTEFKDGANFLESANIETLVLQGNQKAYGIEVYCKRSLKKLEGWISYTYSRSFIKVDGQHAWDKINNGNIYPANYDIPHVFNSVINYHFSRRVVFSSVITYQKGKPITYPTSIYFIDESPYTDYSSRNKYRIPDYFRADFSLTLEGNLKREKLLHSSLMFSLYNATGRKNPYSVFYNIENDKIKSYKYSVIGVPFFTLTWLIKLGNYAS